MSERTTVLDPWELADIARQAEHAAREVFGPEGEHTITTDYAALISDTLNGKRQASYSELNEHPF